MHSSWDVLLHIFEIKCYMQDTKLLQTSSKTDEKYLKILIGWGNVLEINFNSLERLSDSWNL